MMNMNVVRKAKVVIRKAKGKDSPIQIIEKKKRIRSTGQTQPDFYSKVSIFLFSHNHYSDRWERRMS